MRVFLLFASVLLAGCGQPERRLVVPPQPGSWRSDHSGMCCSTLNRNGHRIWLTGKSPGSPLWQIGWIDVDWKFRIVAESPDAVLKADPYGFPVRGCLMPCVVKCGKELRMYHVGVGKERYQFDLNHRPMLAISKDDGASWRRLPEPLLDLEPGEDSIGTHHVWQEFDGWHMIYTSVVAKYPNRRYVLKFAESIDGLRWHKPANNIALDIPDRTCGRPCVWKDGSRYLMTYSFSGGGVKYRIRYADSEDGQHFRDRGQILGVSPDGWDSEMVEYAWVLPDRRHMLYSGNSWGADGIGVAPLSIPK